VSEISISDRLDSNVDFLQCRFYRTFLRLALNTKEEEVEEEEEEEEEI